MLREAFARRLRSLLKEKGIRQKDLARRMQVDKEVVARWLAGSLPIGRTMKRLAEALEASSSWLEGGAGKRETGIAERLSQGGEQSFVRRPAPQQEVGFEQDEHDASQEGNTMYSSDAHKAAEIFDGLLWFFSRLATETEARAEELREKIGELKVNRGKLRKEVAGQNPGWAPSVRTVVWPVPESVDNLLDRIREATATRGERKALASFLGVSPNKVSDWLAKTGRKRPTWKPSGEPTLRMLAWLQDNETKRGGGSAVSKR